MCLECLEDLLLALHTIHIYRASCCNKLVPGGFNLQYTIHIQTHRITGGFNLQYTIHIQTHRITGGFNIQYTIHIQTHRITGGFNIQNTIHIQTHRITGGSIYNIQYTYKPIGLQGVQNTIYNTDTNP